MVSCGFVLLGAPRLQLRMGFFRQGAGAAFEGQGQTRSPFLAEEERPKGLGDEAAGVEVEVGVDIAGSRDRGGLTDHYYSQEDLLPGTGSTCSTLNHKP